MATAEDQAGSAPLVSVVTPFYNTADYLEDCVRSVLAQSYANFEYILVDNCSTDGSRSVAERLASQDSRIRLFVESEFLGQVENYNRALSYVAPAARYFKIVQADDAIESNCLGAMLAVAEADARVGMVTSLYLHGDRICGTGIPSGKQVIDGVEACRMQLLQGVFFFGSPTVPLFRAALLNERKPFYATDRYHEDTEACYEVLLEWRMGYVPAVLSRIRIGNESIMLSRQSFDPMILDRLIVLEMFGPKLLSADELARTRKVLHAGYWECLARAACSFRSADYWKYHRDGLATIGWRIDRVRILWSVLSMLAGLLGSPRRLSSLVRRTLRRLVRRVP